MKNRAKCRLCKAVLHSLHDSHYVECDCGEISISGGSSHLYCFAKDFANFIRVDDLDQEVIVKVEDQEQIQEPKPLPMPDSKPTKDDLMSYLDNMIDSYERLPQNAMSSPISHYDLLSVLLLARSLFKAVS